MPLDLYAALTFLTCVVALTAFGVWTVACILIGIRIQYAKQEGHPPPRMSEAVRPTDGELHVHDDPAVLEDVHDEAQSAFRL